MLTTFQQLSNDFQATFQRLSSNFPATLERLLFSDFDTRARRKVRRNISRLSHVDRRDFLVGITESCIGAAGTITPHSPRIRRAAREAVKGAYSALYGRDIYRYSAIAKTRVNRLIRAYSAWHKISRPADPAGRHKKSRPKAAGLD